MLVGNPGDISDFESIATVTVGAGGSNQIDFTSIPADYTHLQIRCIGRNSGTSVQGLVMFFNNDSSGSYGFGNHRIEGDGSTITASNGGGSPYTAMFFGITPPTNSTASVFSANIIDILDYRNTNKNKVVRCLGGYDANGSGIVNLGSGALFKTDAITSIQIQSAGGTNYLQHSHFALYGIRTA